MLNQWPDFSKTIKARKTVRRVIIDEGSGISERTNGEITFVVESRPDSNGGFAHHCFLFVAKVGYRYPLFRVVQNRLEYPVTVVADLWPQGAAAKDEKELRDYLGHLFRSDGTGNVVIQLLDLLS